ncbi:hypothetical protein PCL_00397 [Purpureocillium lilacinum]|uniref:Uncharacterized protein n=1 Tax=Purpureocillium lilacinum TaxID=33203 RepID=A0A2U3E6Y3_PURLI|nr:hypothetical protein PCL_00397 [Purpureocillium lilacinum]
MQKKTIEMVLGRRGGRPHCVDFDVGDPIPEENRRREPHARNGRIVRAPVGEYWPARVILVRLQIPIFPPAPPPPPPPPAPSWSDAGSNLTRPHAANTTATSTMHGWGAGPHYDYLVPRPAIATRNGFRGGFAGRPAGCTAPHPKLLEKDWSQSGEMADPVEFQVARLAAAPAGICVPPGPPPSAEPCPLPSATAPVPSWFPAGTLPLPVWLPPEASPTVPPCSSVPSWHPGNRRPCDCLALVTSWGNNASRPDRGEVAQGSAWARTSEAFGHASSDPDEAEGGPPSASA